MRACLQRLLALSPLCNTDTFCKPNTRTPKHAIQPLCRRRHYLSPLVKSISVPRNLEHAQKWKEDGSPTPLCLVMYEPVVTLMSMNVILAAMGADDSRHLRWLNDLERFVCGRDPQPLQRLAALCT